jgi:hypothetical protein
MAPAYAAAMRWTQPSSDSPATSDRAPRDRRTAQPHATVTRGVACVAGVALIPLFPQQLARAANGARAHPFTAARFLEEVMEDGAQVSDLRLQVA